jgi:hypothetical protein
VSTLAPKEFERLRTWALDIASTLLPGVGTRDEGPERRWLGQGGFTINRRTGAWFSHAAGRGGIFALALIEFLAGYSREDVIRWALAWLDSHQGIGECTGPASDDGSSPASKAEADRALSEVISDITGMPAEKHLREVRRIEPPFPDGIKWWPDARTGEGAILFELTWHGRVVGCQIGYLTPSGEKSVVLPQRRKLMLEKAPGAHFLIPASTPDAETIIATGIEDALAIRRYMRRTTPVRIIGLPGDSALRHIRIDKGDLITVCRDADVSNPAANQAIADGLDSLLLQAGHAPDWATSPNPTSIFVTNTRAYGKDADAVLIDRGVDGLNEMLEDIERAKLSMPTGVIGWLAGLDRVDLDLEIKRASRATRLRIPTLRAEVADWKKRVGDHTADEPEPVLPDQDVDISATLDALLVEMQRYIVAPVTVLGTAALWAVFTHLVHNDRLMVPVAPRLGIQARTPGCGKTLLLEVLNCVVFNPRAAVSITASTVLRTFGVIKPTMLVDEAHRLLRAHDRSELISVLNVGHYRWNAYAERSVQLANGDWVVERFPVWGTMALASIGELPQDQQERAIVVNLRKVLAKEIPARLRHGSSAELQRLQKAIAGWAATIDELPDVTVPDALQYQPGRVFDNWEPLLQIATLAGGRWPDLVRNAITDTASAEREPAPVERVLAGIKRAFDAVSERVGKDIDRLTTAELLTEMLNDPEEEWGIEYKGRAITAYWLRGALRNLLDPPGAQNWWAPEDRPRPEQKCASGYYRSQFIRSWEVYLDNGAGAAADKDDVHGASEASATSATSTTSATDGGDAGVSEDGLCGRSVPTGPIGNSGCGRSEDADSEDHIAHTEKPEENCRAVADGVDVADVADQSKGSKNNNSRDINGGLDSRRYRRRGDLSRDVRAVAAENLSLTPEQLAKKFGVSRSRIERILGNTHAG